MEIALGNMSDQFFSKLELFRVNPCMIWRLHQMNEGWLLQTYKGSVIQYIKHIKVVPNHIHRCREQKQMVHNPQVTA